MPEERALHVLGLVVDLRVERDVVAAGAGLVAARRVRGEADAGAEIFGECLLFFVAEADAREHHDAVSLDQFDALRPKRLVETVGAINMDDGDRKSVVTGKSVSVRVDLGGRSILKKKNHKTKTNMETASR